MTITFAVSDVQPAATRFDTIDVPEAIHHLTTTTTQDVREKPDGSFEVLQQRPPLVPCEAWFEPPGGVVEIGMHPFVAAVQLAFDQHLPLILSPDHLWLLITQGLAAHIRLHAEQLRPLFVNHEGRVTLTVRRDDFAKGRRENPWPEVFAAFSEQLRRNIGKRHDLIVADFSTTGPLERAVSEVALMDAMSNYFEYKLRSICGIPSVTLLGEPDDWRSIRTRALVFQELGMGGWLNALTPVLDQIVAASEGRADRGFWQSLYKRKSASGGPYITGWINTLLPYLRHPVEDRLEPNSHLAGWHAGMDSPFGGGPTSAELPGCVSSVPFIWEHLDDTFRMAFLGGFIGVQQDVDSGAVTPQLGWAIREHDSVAAEPRQMARCTSPER